MNEQQNTPEIETPAVVFTYKKRVPIQIELDLDALTWEDNIRFSSIQDKIEKGEVTTEQGLEAVTLMLSKMAGQDVSKMPLSVVAALLQEFKRLAEVRTQELKN